jgi:putative zinc finger protein
MKTQILNRDGDRLMGSHDAAARHPSTEQLAAFLERRLHGSEREVLMEHLADCTECRHDVTTTSRVLSSARASRRRQLVRPIVGAAAAAVLVFALTSRLHRDPPDRAGEVRSQRVNEPDAISPIVVVSPTNGTAPGRNTVLMWRADAPSALYKVALLDSTGSAKWSARTTDTSAVVPDSVRLSAGATYYWTVDALRQDGRATTSGAHWFIR